MIFRKVGNGISLQMNKEYILKKLSKILKEMEHTWMKTKEKG